MTMKKFISSESKKTKSGFRSLLVLILSLGIAFVMTPASSVQAQKYSDWSTPINLGAIINSAFSDQGPAVSKDRLTLYFHSNRPGGFGGFDIYVSHRLSVADAWDPPVNLGPALNTTFDEGNPAFSRDGHFLFFQSIRPGGLGGIDLWVAYREHTHDGFDWQTPVNLGAGVNSTADDNAPSYLENDELGAAQIYFVSSRPGLGGQDIYLSNQMPDGSFGPASLVSDLSTTSTDSRPSIRHDGREIIFQSNRPGSLSTALDLWVATRASALDGWSTPVNLGSPVNTTAIDNNAHLSSDRLTLFFSSDRPGGFGGLDLYVTTRTKIHGQPGKLSFKGPGFENFRFSGAHHELPDSIGLAQKSVRACRYRTQSGSDGMLVTSCNGNPLKSLPRRL
jgi:WD40-like Beta Propeller Repeat